MAPNRARKRFIKRKLPFVCKRKLTSQRKKKVGGKLRQSMGHTGGKSLCIVNHVGGKSFKCKQCDKVFKQEVHLFIHLDTHTSKNTFICSQCDSGFTKKDDLLKHHMVHAGEQPYCCIHCKVSFALKYNLDEHMIKCTGKAKEKPYQCTYCDKAFAQKPHLTTHTRTHTGEKPFKCNLCEKDYISKDALRLHIQLHTGEKPHKCSYCNKEFVRLGHLKRHTNTHTLDKLYPCSQCNSTFLQIANLKSHMMRIHAEKKEPNQIDPPKMIHITHLKTHASSPGVCFGRIKQNHVKSLEVNINPQIKSVDNNISDELSTSDQSSIPLFCDDPSVVLLWFQRNKLLKSVWSCDSCHNLMDWSVSSRSRYGFEWICQTKGCAKYQHSECIILESLFSNSCVTLTNWLDIMYLWSENVKARVTSKLVGISLTQINNCFSSLREVCQVYLIENPIKLGGLGKIIEIDVATFPANSKPNQPNPPIMVLGIIDSKSSPLKGYMEIVESNNAASLLPILYNVIEPGSIIYSKESKEYQKVNLEQSVQFLNIDSSEYDTKIELFWDRHKTNLNDIHSCLQESQNSHLQELMWRDQFYDNSFESLCQHITSQYPL